MPTIRDAIILHAESESARKDTEWAEKHQGQEPHLFVSSLGGCGRAAFHSAVQHLPDHPFHREITHPFPPYVIEVMRAGVVWEAETELALKALYGEDVECQVDASDDVWGCRIDFVLADELIVEHKATNPWNFTKNGRIPYDHHLMQVAAELCLLEKKRSKPYWATLFYRSWNHWAELAVTYEPYDNRIIWSGEIDGYTKHGELFCNLAYDMMVWRSNWCAQLLPDKYNSPTQVDFTCTRNTKHGPEPSCRYFGHCWTEEDL